MEQTQHWSEIFERTAVGYVTAYDQLSEQVNPNLYTLLAYFKAYHTYNGFDERGLEAKLEALQHEPTALEKTMTEAQLYKANSPLWANNLTASQARAIIEADENLHKGTEKARGFHPGMNRADNIFKYTYSNMTISKNFCSSIFVKSISCIRICLPWYMRIFATETNRKDKLCHYQ